MNVDQVMNLRHQALEQFAQVNADLQELHQRKKALKKEAEVILQKVRHLTHQINQANAQPQAQEPQLQLA